MQRILALLWLGLGLGGIEPAWGQARLSSEKQCSAIDYKDLGEMTPRQKRYVAALTHWIERNSPAPKEWGLPNQLAVEIAEIMAANYPAWVKVESVFARLVADRLSRLPIKKRELLLGALEEALDGSRSVLATGAPAGRLPPHYNHRKKKIHVGLEEESDFVRFMVAFHELDHAIYFVRPLESSIRSIVARVEGLMPMEFHPVSSRLSYQIELSAVGNTWELVSRLPLKDRVQLLEQISQRVNALEDLDDHSSYKRGAVFVLGTMRKHLENAHLSKTEYAKVLMRAHGYGADQLVLSLAKRTFDSRNHAIFELYLLGPALGILGAGGSLAALYWWVGPSPNR